MADVPSALADWSTTPASNTPNRPTAIGAGLADNLQQVQATVRAGLAYKGADIAAASTVNLATATGSRLDVTHASGTVAITSFGTVSAGIWKIVKFSIAAGTLSVTHNATSLKLPGGVSIAIADGDVMFLSSLGSGNWECLFYQRSSWVYPSPLGSLVEVMLNITGSEEPPTTHYIRLKSGLTGSGGYNNGKLTSESVSGSAPNIVATAVINDAQSPLNGKTVRLVEDERRFLRPGSPGTLEDSALKSHAHTASGWTSSSGDHQHTTQNGAGGNSNVYNGGTAGATQPVAAYNTSSVNGAHTHGVGVTVNSTGDTETRPRNVGVAVYMRYK